MNVRVKSAYLINVFSILIEDEVMTMTMTMTVVSLFLMFVLGFVVALVSILFYGFSTLKSSEVAKAKAQKTDSILQQLLEKTKSLKPLDPSVKARLEESFDITERQLSILGSLDMPQSGPLHGKHKNLLMHELKTLETRKMELLKSIIEDGYNPKLVIINSDSGERESVFLSEFLSKQAATEKEAALAKPPQSKAPMPKLRVLTKDEMSETL